MHLPALVAYLQGLRENNNKAWFVMNKPAYDILRAEFMVLVAAVIAGLSKHDQRIADVNPKKALFRIYRDIRFSNDKTPYKAYFSASIAEEGAKNSGPMYYLSINAEGNLHLGAGCYLPERDVLAALRRHVVADHAGLARIAKARRFVRTFGTLSQEDKLTRLPKGYDPGMPGIERFGESLKLKSFVVSANFDLATGSHPDLAPTIVAAFAAALPLNDWLREGLTTQLVATPSV
ncbi:MAG: DUF2461 domain-containing protein [Burkholderiaceae bacterium]